jgi:hypothetical protein
LGNRIVPSPRQPVQTVIRVKTLFTTVAFLALSAALQGLPAPATTIEQYPTRAGVFSIRLASNKSVYRVGERIELRVTIRNNTAQRYGVEWAPPYGLSRLQILDYAGRPVASKGAWGFMLLRPEALHFSPGEALVVPFPDPEYNGDIREWAAIKYWGYELTRPGKYTIVAFATFQAFGEPGPEFASSATKDKSNAVHITIIP